MKQRPFEKITTSKPKPKQSPKKKKKDDADKENQANTSINALDEPLRSLPFIDEIIEADKVWRDKGGIQAPKDAYDS
eukprot:COSAG04_NODE_16021_length_512_cov_1.121065_1_plen_76_part_01